MATYFVASGGSNTAPYETWAKAATSLQTALTAASTAGDIVVIQYDGVPSGDAGITADTTYAFEANISLISASNDGASDYTPTAMGDSYWVGTSSGAYAITMGGVGQIYVYGLTLRNAGSATDHMSLGINRMAFVYEACTVWLGTTGAGARIMVGPASASGAHAQTKLYNCVFRFSDANQGFSISSISSFYSCSLHASSSTVSRLFAVSVGPSSTYCDGCDWSASGLKMISNSSTTGMSSARFVNCKVPGSLTWLDTQTYLTLASSEVYVFNCASGDTHYDFGYYNALGSVVSTTGIYASGGAKYDGTNGVSWQIDTSSAASYGVPFVTPWIDLYHSGTAAITPKLEILRDSSATAYDNDEVWAEFSYQGTASSTKATIVDDRMALAGTPAAQTTGDLGAGDWTGENATSWFGKLNTTSTITPAEIGMLRARVCVGVASSTVYVDPYIRVA